MRLYEYLYLLLFLCIPLSFDYRNAGIGILLPSEPLQIVITLALLLHVRTMFDYWINQKRNPLFITLLLYILWGWFTCFFAKDKLVSVKYASIETLHFIVFFLGPPVVLDIKENVVRKLILCYTIPLLILMFRGWYNAYLIDFPISFSLAALWPFYDDHTIYGAVAAFLLPFWIIRFEKKEQNKIWKALCITIAILLGIGLFMSYSRAAWLSFLVAAAFALIIHYAKSREKLKSALMLTFLSALLTIPLFFIATQKKEYVKNSDLVTHLFSSFNWTYDVANLERLNRYKCSLRMIKERPITGFGLNGFKYNYTAYQKKEDMTRISITDVTQTARKGTGGNSHNEYLEVFVGTGIPGFMIWCCALYFSCYFAIQVYSKEKMIIGLIIFASLLSFYMHGFVNSFFHDDKIACLVWLSYALLIVFSSKYKSRLSSGIS